MTILGLLLGIVMGLSLALLGGGGSILAVPILKYALGFGAKEAIASSLAVVGTTSLFGAIGHQREGRVRMRTALLFGAFAMVGAYLGAKYLAPFFSGAAQLALFGAVMLAAAFFMFRERESGDEQDRTEDHARWTYLLLLPALGMAVGVLTGLVGVGGGFLIVPALVLLANVPMKGAVGTSLLVIAMNSASGFVGYLGEVEVRWGIVALFTALALAGSFAGARLVRHVPHRVLRRSFAALLVTMAAFILYENREAIPFL